jgi:hypothetical protein
MSMDIDQTRDDPAATHIDFTGLPRELEAGAGSDRFDLPAANHERRIGQSGTTSTVDEGSAEQRHTVGSPLLATQEEQPRDSKEYAAASGGHWMSGREGSSTLQACAP